MDGIKAAHLLGSAALLSCNVEELNCWYKGFANALDIVQSQKVELAERGLPLNHPEVKCVLIRAVRI